MLSGALRLEATAGDRDVLVDVARAVTVFGQSARRGGGPRIVTARAGPASEVMLVSDHALERIAADLPDLWRGVSALVYAQLDASVHRMAQMLVLPPRARVLARVRSLARGGVARVSQADLAELTGLSRKTVNEHLGGAGGGGRGPVRAWRGDAGGFRRLRIARVLLPAGD